MNTSNESIPLNDSTLPPSRRVQLTYPSKKESSNSSTSNTITTKKNPRSRRKTEGVRRGFGLHDWNRLLKSSNDLAQRKGQSYRSITPSEIRKHNDEYDAWISLHGKVYNITPYLHYHPGGIRIMKPCLGGDATALFEKYHRWVNLQGLIGPLLLGDLKPEQEPSSSEKEDQFVFAMPAPRPPSRTPIPSLLRSSHKQRTNVTTLDEEDESDLNPWDKL